MKTTLHDADLDASSGLLKEILAGVEALRDDMHQSQEAFVALQSLSEVNSKILAKVIYYMINVC